MEEGHRRDPHTPRNPALHPTAPPGPYGQQAQYHFPPNMHYQQNSYTDSNGSAQLQYYSQPTPVHGNSNPLHPILRDQHQSQTHTPNRWDHQWEQRTPSYTRHVAQEDREISPASSLPPHVHRKMMPAPDFELPDTFGVIPPSHNATPYQSPPSLPAIDSDDDDMPPTVTLSEKRSDKPKKGWPKSKSESHPPTKNSKKPASAAARASKTKESKTKESKEDEAKKQQQKDGGKSSEKGGHGGRIAGSRNFGDDETMELLRLVELYMPVGAKGWDAIKEAYEVFSKENGFVERDTKSLRDKFYRLVNEVKPTGEGVKSDAIRMAQEIDACIEARGGAATIDDRDGSPIVLDSNGNGTISMSDSSEEERTARKKRKGVEQEKKTKGPDKKKDDHNFKTVGTKAYRVDPPLPPPHVRRNNAAATASGALTSLSGFFNPEAALERDANRSANAFQLAALNHSQVELQAARARIDTLTDRLQEAQMHAERAEFKAKLLEQELSSLRRRRRRSSSTPPRRSYRSRSDSRRSRARHHYSQRCSPESNYQSKQVHERDEGSPYHHSSQSRSSSGQVHEYSPIASSSHITLDGSEHQDERQIHLVLTPTRAWNGQRAYTVTPKAT